MVVKSFQNAILYRSNSMSFAGLAGVVGDGGWSRSAPRRLQGNLPELDSSSPSPKVSQTFRDAL